MIKAIKQKLKGQDVLICRCGTVVQNLASTEYFPEGYSYNECPVCHNEIDLNPEEKVVEKTKPSDMEIIQRWIDEAKKAKEEAAKKEEAVK